MIIKRYIVTICTPGDECAYIADMVASYVQDGIPNSQVTAYVIEAAYKDEGEIRFDIKEAGGYGV